MIQPSELKKVLRIIVNLALVIIFTYVAIYLTVSLQMEWIFGLLVVVLAAIWLVRLVRLIVRFFRWLYTDEPKEAADQNSPSDLDTAGDSANPASKSSPPDAPPSPGRT